MHARVARRRFNQTLVIAVRFGQSGPVYDTVGLTLDQANTALASAQVLAFGTAPAVSGGDGPLPPWAYGLLAGLLVWLGARSIGRPGRLHA